jgi:signal recognition particle subunit SRP54
MALDGLKRQIMGSVGLLKGKRKVDEETVRELSRSLRKALLEADFNVRQSKELTERIELRLAGVVGGFCSVYRTVLLAEEQLSYRLR